jgi:hypothetical protein
MVWSKFSNWSLFLAVTLLGPQLRLGKLLCRRSN